MGTTSCTRTGSIIIVDHEAMDRSRRIGADARAALTRLARLVVGRQRDRLTTAPGWTFLTNHGHALVCIARNGDIRLRDLASSIGITERTAQIIVNDLAEADYVTRTRVGNRSHYTVRADRPFRHPVEIDHSVGALLAVVASTKGEPGP